MENKKIPAKICYGENATKLHFATDGAAAFDISASGPPVLNEWGCWEVPTDLFIEVPKGYALFLYIRSGMARKGISLANGVGVVDSDYRGEVKGMLHIWGENSPQIEKGQRFMQGIIRRVEPVELIEVESLSETERGTGGFGSTGF